MRAVARLALAGQRCSVPVVLLVTLLIVGAMAHQAAAPPRSWTVSVGRTPVALAVAERSGRVFVASSADDTVRMLDARSGQTLATSTVGHTPAALTVDEAHGRVFTLNACVVSALDPEQACPNGAGSISALDLHSDTLLRTLNLGQGAAVPAVDERARRVFASTYGAPSVGVLDAASGRQLGTVALGGAFQAMVVDAPLHHLVVSTLTSAGGGSSVRLFDSRSGALLATTPMGQYVRALLCDTRAGRVLVAGDGDLYLLDARTGRTLRRIRDGGEPLAVDERTGRALISGQGHPRFISTRDGAPLRPGLGALDGLSVEAVAVDEATTRFYVAADGALWVLDGRSGRVERALSLLERPLALAVDAAAQRVFILNDGTTDVPIAPSGESRLVSWLRRTLPWVSLPATPPPAAGGTVTVVDTARL